MAIILNSGSGGGGEGAMAPPPSPVKISHKKMATKYSRIVFMFLCIPRGYHVVHYVAHTSIGKWPVALRLNGLLVRVVRVVRVCLCTRHQSFSAETNKRRTHVALLINVKVYKIL